MKRLAGAVAVALCAPLFGTGGAETRRASQLPPAHPAVPIDPIVGVLDAFRSHSLVALGEGRHGNEQSHQFRLALVRDPRFASLLQDIVVEFGSARHQTVMDRFIRGEEVRQDELRLAWQDTTQPHAIWDRPIYEEFFAAVRTVNAALPRERQLRLLLGDPPLDWNQVRSEADYDRLVSTNRNRHPFSVIQREVLSKKRRALLVYGDMHFVRRHALYNYDVSPALDANSIVALLQRHEPGSRVFTIWTNTTADLQQLQSDVSAWPKPALALLRGTVLGAADFRYYNPTEMARYSFRGGKPDFSNPIPRDQWRPLRMEDQFDATLYLGHPSSITIAQVPPMVCKDTAYIAMRAKRSAAVGWAQGDFDRLKSFCADQLSREAPR